MTSQDPSPLMRQYREIKRGYPQAILFFRVGDFYEMFYEDAFIASKILDIALTSRDKNKDSAVPMCGVPYHSAEGYIPRLIQKGYRVAICEQVEDPKSTKGIVRREVVRAADASPGSGATPTRGWNRSGGTPWTATPPPGWRTTTSATC